MVSNSSSVPRRMLRNSGIRPMPSGSNRQTSSVMPGRMVGFTMPTTPRQLENDIALPPALLLVRRNIPLRDVARVRFAVAARRVAVTAAARALQKEALAGLQFEPRRGLGLDFLVGADPDDKAGRAAGLPAAKP